MSADGAIAPAAGAKPGADADAGSAGAAPRARRLLERRYRFLAETLAPERALRIADVGANPINRPDYADLLELGGCELWGFEPEPKAFAELQANPRPGAHYLNVAVGRPGPARFHLHPQNGLGSLYPIRAESVAYLGHPGWYRGDADSVEITLQSLDEMEELPPPDMLKIDIQGGELDVIRTGRAKLAQAVCIVPEVRFYRIYEGEPLWGPLDCELHDQGFRLHRIVFSKSVMVANSQQRRLKGKAMRNQLMDGDAIYIRDPETIAHWSATQVKHLALVSATVFDSFDLTVFCLDELVRRGELSDAVPGAFVDLLPRWARAGG